MAQRIIHRAPYVEVQLRCPMCAGRKLLWMGGGDYVECGTCDGKGSVQAIETRMQGVPNRALITEGLLQWQR
jgi:DnaJ-class molecular chaperone